LYQTAELQNPQPIRWVKRLAQYRTPNNHWATFELAVTLLTFATLWTITWGALQLSVWLCLLMTIPTAGFLVRLFMIQHDCGHGSLFTSKVANDWIGRAIGVLTVTPYDFWKHSHAMHHAGSGNLEHRGIGDIRTLTVSEYQKLSAWQRFGYWLYRHPIVMFGIGPVYLFIFQQRLPVGGMRRGLMPWASTMFTNAAIASVVVLLIYFIGWKAFLLIQVPVIAVAGSIGVWLFYLQHQFEDTFWERPPNWNHEDAALHGSSYYDLPKPLMWLTGYIGAHHLHHLANRIPFYNLPKVLKAYPEFTKIGRMTFMDSIRCVRLTLWCETEKRMISFREQRARRNTSAATAAK
jgi:acyl-lipid omega-6 desaturase (Delta-12 desaturase)